MLPIWNWFVIRTVLIAVDGSSGQPNSQPPVSYIKVYLLDYATPEVPLPLFDLGHDWASTFREVPLPQWGQAWASEFTLWRVSTLIRLWLWVGRCFRELRGHFHWHIVVLHSVALRCIIPILFTLSFSVPVNRGIYFFSKQPWSILLIEESINCGWLWTWMSAVGTML